VSNILRLTLGVDYSLGSILTRGFDYATFPDVVQEWADNFNHPAYSILPSPVDTTSPTNKVAHAYVNAPANVTPDTISFVRLAQLWSNHGIVVTKIEQVPGVPDPDTDQAALDAENPGVLDAAGNFAKGTFASVTKILNGVATVGEYLALAAIVFALVYYKPWRYLPTMKGARR